MGNLSARVRAFIDDENRQEQRGNEVQEANEALIEPFIQNTVIPAFSELREALKSSGQVVNVYNHGQSARIHLGCWCDSDPEEQFIELTYRVEPKALEHGFMPTVRIRHIVERTKSEAVLGDRSPVEDLSSITRQMVIESVFGEWQELERARRRRRSRT